MASRTITLQRTLRDGTNVIGGDATTHTVGAVAEIPGETIPAESTDLLVNIAFPKANLQVLYMLAVGGDMTIETNDSAAPDDTISLKADSPLIWVAADAYHTNPVDSADVTKIYVTSTAGGTLYVYAGYDPTP